MSKEKGVCFFAYNNEQIDYIKLAILAAAHVKKHLNVPVTVITDEGTYSWLKSSQGINESSKYIDDVVITEDEMQTNPRKHWDSPWSSFNAPFLNGNKHKIWEYSPYEKTLLLDIDYIVRNDFLNHSWDQYTGVCMYSQACDLRNELPGSRERFLFDAGIPMWWSTVVYFDRTEVSKLFFGMWEHISENYDYYQYLYNFPGKLFRTDYCVSIATHILNGMVSGDHINSFPNQLINMDQKDDIVEIRDNSEWIMLSNDTNEKWKNILVNNKSLDVHCMNKRAIDRHYDKIMETVK